MVIIMSKYTITIKNLIDNHFDFKMTSYPIFDENYRDILNQKILYHYYEDEIGFETAPLFRFYLNNKLNEIMPYYNELYKVQQNILSKDLLNNVNLTEHLEGSNTTETSSTSDSTNTGSSNSKNLYQDTPQGNISNQDIDAQNVYATNITLDNNNTSNSISDKSSSSGNGTNEYLKTIVGNNGKKFNIEILNDIKNNLMNIDLMIINELSDLFMGIF